MQAFDYIFNVGGNFQAKLDGMAKVTGEFSGKMEQAQGWAVSLAQKMAAFDLACGYIEKLVGAFDGLSAAGISLDSQMHDLSAVAGVTGESLKEIEGYARDSAKTFGTDASVAVEGYKLLLSQLTPELGKCPAALSAMGNAIQTTSKLMGGDGVAAAEVLTTAMNQYGVSLEDPMAASREMARMMNVMAAAGQEGSAELPAIKVALEQCGMAAKAASVSFEETNAAIQVLDKAGKKGSEGGVALRNTLAILSRGRFLPEKTQEELRAAGVDVLRLADTSLSLRERLDMLKPVLADSALFSQLFGMENANAARALVQSTDELGRLTAAVTGTTSAEEQAATVMDSYAERQARIRQQIEDVKISLFQATGGATLWMGALSGVLVPVAQLLPLLTGLGSAMRWIRGLQWAGLWRGIRGALYATRIQALLMNRELVTGQFVSCGFAINIARATLALARFATVGLWNGIKALGSYLLSLVTTGSASTAFAAISTTSFTTFKLTAVTACRAVGVAIMNIPIVGWIAAIIAGLIALGTYFWNTSATFRAVLKGLWAAFKTYFSAIAKLGFEVFGALGDLIRSALSLDGDGMSKALDRLKKGVTGAASSIGDAFTKAYNAEMKASAAKGKKPKKKGQNVPAATPADGTGGAGDPINPVGGSLASASGSRAAESSGGSGTIRNISVHVDRLVERFEVHTTNLAADTSRIKELVAQALLSAVNDVNLAI